MKNFLRNKLNLARKRDEWFAMHNKNFITGWCVYILECADGTYYTGITNNLPKRLNEHNTSARGAKYTRSRRPVELLEHVRVKNKSQALRLEYKIKSLKRSKKINNIWWNKCSF